MESIASIDAQSRFIELLDRTAQGERFLIKTEGRSAAMLVPFDPVAHAKTMSDAAAQLKEFRGALRGVSRDELIAWKNEGRRY